MTAAVILAAGAGRRLGGVAKALLRTATGATFLDVIQNTAAAAGVRRSVVVVGPPHGEAVEREARRLGLAVVVNPYPARGMASSVEIGFGYAQTYFPRQPCALLWPVDHPAVRPEVVATIIRHTTVRNAVIPMFEGRGGHPTGFGRELWQDLAACGSAPRGARTVIQALETDDRGRVQRIAVTDPGVVRDVDTPACREQGP